MNIDSFDKLEKHLLDKGATFLGKGRHRKSFLRRGVVYKLPWNDGGVEANRTEASMYKRHGRTHISGTPLAGCRLLKNNILAMEYLQPPPFDLRGGSVPRWACGWDWNSEGAQIGFDKKGNLRIFDYAES